MHNEFSLLSLPSANSMWRWVLNNCPVICLVLVSCSSSLIWMRWGNQFSEKISVNEERWSCQLFSSESFETWFFKPRNFKMSFNLSFIHRCFYWVYGCTCWVLLSFCPLWIFIFCICNPDLLPCTVFLPFHLSLQGFYLWCLVLISVVFAIPGASIYEELIWGL